MEVPHRELTDLKTTRLEPLERICFDPPLSKDFHPSKTDENNAVIIFLSFERLVIHAVWVHLAYFSWLPFSIDLLSQGWCVSNALNQRMDHN